jgi:hypothetical protein
VDRITFRGSIIETGTDSYRLAQTRATYYCDHLDVDWKRDVRCQFFCEGVASSQTTDGPSERLSDDLVDLRLRFEDDGCAERSSDVSQEPGIPRRARRGDE